MLLLSERPKTAREWRGTIGIDNQQFTKLASLVEQEYVAKRGQSLTEVLQSNSNGSKFRVRSYEDGLFFVLLILKMGATYDQIAFIYGFDLSTVKRNFDNWLLLLHNSLAQSGLLPIREFDNPSDFAAYFNKDVDIIIDGTEQRIQRPLNSELQKEHYSGKKKAHTHKCLIISTPDTYVHFVSQVYSGKQHDFTILKQEFDPSEEWFKDYTVRLDLGYQGFAKDYPQALAYLPNKKPLKRELSDEQKSENKKLAKQRITIEHSIGGMKRYEMLSGQSRLHNEGLYSQIVATCAGLWNFFITN